MAVKLEKNSLICQPYLNLWFIVALSALLIFLLLALYGVDLKIVLVACLGISAVFIIFAKPFIGLLICLFIEFSGIIWGFSLGRGFLVAVLLTIVAWVIQDVWKLRFKVILDNHYLPILGFFFFVLLSVYAAQDQKQSFGYLILCGKLFIFYFLVINLINSRDRFVIATKVIVISMLLSAFYGFCDLLLNFSWDYLLTWRYRVRGFSHDPNIFGINILIVFPLLVLFFFHYRERWKKSFLLLSSVLLILALITTLSRGAMIGLMFVITYLLYLERKRKITLAVLVALLLLLLFTIPAEVLMKRIGTLTEISRDPSLRWRARLFSGALSLFSQHPFTGIGIGNFVLISNNFINRYLCVHNTLLEVATEIGIFGFFLFIVILWTTYTNFRVAYASFKRLDDEIMTIICRSLQIGFLGIITTSLFFSIQLYFVLWTVFALSVSARRIAKRQKEQVGLNHGE